MLIERTMNDKVIAGVCGGIAKRFMIPSRTVRFAFILLIGLAGLSPLVYFILWFIFPKDIETYD